MAETTFCIWRRTEDDSWQTGQIQYPEDEDPDGSEGLLFILDGDPKTYQEFAEQYYERAIDLVSVTSIYEHQPLTSEIVKKLNPDVPLETLSSDIAEIDILSPQSNMCSEHAWESQTNVLAQRRHLASCLIQ